MGSSELPQPKKIKYLYMIIFIFINMNEDLKILKAISDETRLKIAKLLCSGEKCGSEIMPLVGKSQPNISIHLSKLKNAGIIESRRDGKKIYYYFSNERAKKIIDSINEDNALAPHDFIEEV
jgi:DNA-binding transcriptional ArsR family regulator